MVTTVRQDRLATYLWPRILLVLTVLFWSGNSIVGRAVHDQVPPISLAFWRWTVAALLLLPFVAGRLGRDWPAIRAGAPRLVLLSALGVASFNTFLYGGLQSTTAINALLLQTMTPIVIVALAALGFGEYVSRRQALGMLCALIGVVVIIGRGSAQVLLALSPNPGDLLILAGVVSYSLYTVLLRGRPRIDPLSFVALTFIIGALQLLPFYLWELAEKGGFGLSAPVIAAIAYVAVFPSILSYLCYNRGVEAIGASQAGVFMFLMPVLGSGMAIGFLNESLAWFHAAGAVAIVAGIWLASGLRLRRAAA